MRTTWRTTTRWSVICLFALVGLAESSSRVSAEPNFGRRAPATLVSEEVLHIPTMGRTFLSALTVGADGNVYGTTTDSIFRIDGAGVLSTVHTFLSNDGFPARLVVGSDGLLYGLTGQVSISPVPP